MMKAPSLGRQPLDNRASKTQRAPPAICRRGSRPSASCDEDPDEEEDEKARKPSGLGTEEVQQHHPGDDGEAHPRFPLERNAPTPQPRRMRDASGLGSRSAGNLETGLFDLDDEIAGETGLDAQRA